MRRILSLFMLCALLGGTLPQPAAHAEAVQDGDFTYFLLMDNTFAITDYSGTSSDVVIPSEFDGKPVTAIGPSAFDPFNNPGQPKLTSVTLPPSVTMISSYAFARNELTEIEISSVTQIGRGAFQYNRLQSVVLGEVTLLDEYAFADNQLVSVSIPNSLATIERYVFQNNRLSSVSFPEGLGIIDSDAFNGNQLNTLQIPKSVTAIYPGAFMNNPLKVVVIPPEVALGGSLMSPVFDRSMEVLYLSRKSLKKVFDYTTKYNININPCDYEISYDGNGNTGGAAPSATSYTCYRNAFQVPVPDPDQDPSALTKKGYTFKGWNTEPDGSGTNYSGGNYPLIYGIRGIYFTLYANWEPNSYQVTFDTGWGATSADQQTILCGKLAKEPQAPSRTDYVFEGWYTDSSYTDAWDFGNDTVTEDMTLYAKWKWNGAATIASVELAIDDKNIKAGDTLTINGVVRDDNGSPVANAVVSLNSTMGKWELTDDSDVSATTDANGEITAVWKAPLVTDPESVTITASVDGTIGMLDSQTFQVVPLEMSNEYSVSYETNGGTAIPAATAIAGALLDEPAPAPSKAGYRFAGWYKDPGYATQWNFEQDTVAGDTILYAKWESKQLAISLVTFSSAVLSGQEISVTGTVYDQGNTPQANISVHLSSSNGGKWSLTETDKATATTDENGAFEVIWKAPHVFATATAELSASLDGSNAEPVTLSIQVSPLPGPNPSSDADLAGLTLSGGDLTPRFQAGVASYTAEVGYAMSSVSIVLEVSDLAATVTVNGNTAESGQPVQVNLNVGSNPVTIIVLAEDGTTTNTYHVTITRASAPVDAVPVAGISVTSVQSSVYVGGTLQMIASVSPDDAANKRVSWSIQSGTGRAVIDENGLLRAEHAGIVTVQATAQDGSGIVGSRVITIYERQPDGGDPPTTPAGPTPTNPTPTNPTTQPPERLPLLKVVPGRPPFDANDAGAIQTMLDALAARFNDPRNANVPVFPDAEHHWAADNIRLFARLGIVEGYGDGTFKPDASITRGEFASMIVKLFPLTHGTAATPGFTDIGNSWARDAVLTLASNGIINGYEDGTFRADRKITRAEIIAILARMVNLAAAKQEKTVNFKDIDHSWAKDHIRLAANVGIIDGRSENVFDPNKSATRSEALTVLLRAISLSPEIKQLLEGMN